MVGLNTDPVYLEVKEATIVNLKEVFLFRDLTHLKLESATIVNLSKVCQNTTLIDQTPQRIKKDQTLFKAKKVKIVK